MKAALLTVLVSVEPAEAWHRLRRHARRRDLHVVVLAGARSGRVELEVEEVEPELAHARLAHLNSQVAKLFVRVRGRKRRILEVDDLLARGHVAGARHDATGAEAGGARRRRLPAKQLALEGRVTGARLIGGVEALLVREPDYAEQRRPRRQRPGSRARLLADCAHQLQPDQRQERTCKWAWRARGRQCKAPPTRTHSRSSGSQSAPNALLI